MKYFDYINMQSVLPKASSEPSKRSLMARLRLFLTSKCLLKGQNNPQALPRMQKLKGFINVIKSHPMRDVVI